MLSIDAIGVEITSSSAKHVPGSRWRAGEVGFHYAILGMGVLVVAITVAIACVLAFDSRLAWGRFGLSFLWTTAWDPVAGKFGALPFIYGTMVSSLLALIISAPLGVGSAIFLAEKLPGRISDFCTFLIELLAAVPSVVLGLIGIFVLVPWVRIIETWMTRLLGWLPFFQGQPIGVGLLMAGLILAFMILPYITVITREVLLAVPSSLKEGILALGATRWETLRTVSLPYSMAGIYGAIFLALGRALGETMAVTMVIGNTPKISASLLDPSHSMAAVVANELAEAFSDIHAHSLIAVSLTLFLITVVVNGLARLLIARTSETGS